MRDLRPVDGQGREVVTESEPLERRTGQVDGPLDSVAHEHRSTGVDDLALALDSHLAIDKDAFDHEGVDGRVSIGQDQHRLVVLLLRDEMRHDTVGHPDIERVVCHPVSVRAVAVLGPLDAGPLLLAACLEHVTLLLHAEGRQLRLFGDGVTHVIEGQGVECSQLASDHAAVAESRDDLVVHRRGHGVARGRRVALDGGHAAFASGCHGSGDFDLRRGCPHFTTVDVDEGLVHALLLRCDCGVHYTEADNHCKHFVDLNECK